MNWILFLLLSCIWGFSFIGINFSLEGLPPFAAAAFRIGLSVVIMVIWALLKKVPFSLSKRTTLIFLGLGIANFGFPWACLFWGEQHVAPGIASILNSTVPFFVFIFSWLFLGKEQPRSIDLIGVGLGFLGILLVFVPSIHSIEIEKNHLLGMTAILGMAISYGFGAVWLKRFVNRVHITWNLILQGSSSVVFLLICSCVMEPWHWVDSIHFHLKALISIVYLALFSTVIAWVIYIRLLNHWGVLRASVVTYVVPFIAIGIDWIYFHKLPTNFQLLGALTIVSALGMINSPDRDKKTLEQSSPFPQMETKIKLSAVGGKRL